MQISDYPETHFEDCIQNTFWTLQDTDLYLSYTFLPNVYDKWLQWAMVTPIYSIKLKVITQLVGATTDARCE